jgi:hypothetical protein
MRPAAAGQGAGAGDQCHQSAALPIAVTTATTVIVSQPKCRADAARGAPADLSIAKLSSFNRRVSDREFEISRFIDHTRQVLDGLPFASLFYECRCRNAHSWMQN